MPSKENPYNHIEATNIINLKICYETLDKNEVIKQLRKKKYKIIREEDKDCFLEAEFSCELHNYTKIGQAKEVIGNIDQYIHHEVKNKPRYF